MARDPRRWRKRLEDRRKGWITTFLLLALVVFIAFAIEAGSTSETYFGLTVAVWMIGIVPLLGFSMVRPVARAQALDRTAAFFVKLLCGVPAVIGALTVLLFIASVLPGGLGWSMELGSDLVSYAPAMFPAAAGNMLASAFIARTRASRRELNAVYAAVGIVGGLAGFAIIAFLLGVPQAIVAVATPAVIAAMAAFTFVVYRLYTPAAQQAHDFEGADAEEEAQLAAMDPWHALRRF